MNSHRGQNLLSFYSDFTVIDLETTGRSNYFYDITEISAIRYRRFQKVASFSTLVKAKRSILPFVTSLTGISDEMLEDAPDIEDVIEAFIAFIDEDVILGHNVNFDFHLISSAYYHKSGKEIKNDYIDTLRISRLLNRDIANHKLETLTAYFDVERYVAHRGLADCEQTAQVYLAMRHKYKKLYLGGNNDECL